MKLKVLVCFAIIFMIVVTACTNNSNRQIPEEGTTEAKTSVELVVVPETTRARTTAENTSVEPTTAEMTTKAETTTVETTAYYENNEQYKKTAVSNKTINEWGIKLEGVNIANIWLYKNIPEDDFEGFESDIIVIEINSNSKDFVVSLDGGAELLECKLIRISHQCSIFTSGKTLKLKGFSEGLRKITLSTSEWTSIVYTESVNASIIIFKFQ